MNDEQVWTVRTEMSELLRTDRAALRATGFMREGTRLNLLLKPHTSVQELEALLRKASERADVGYWFMRSATLGVSLVIGGTILMFLALIDLFSQLVGVIISEQSPPSGWHVILLLGTFLIGAVVVSFAPQLLGGDDGRIRGIITRWLNEDARAISRINRRLRSAKSRGSIHTLIIWNATPHELLTVDQLIACVAKVPLKVDLQVHQDEHSLTVSSLRSRNQVVADTDPHHASAGIPLTSDTARVLGSIAGVGAELALRSALIASSYAAAGEWKAAIAASGAFPQGTISTRLAARIFAVYVHTDGATSHGLARLWLHRLIHDYRLFEHGWVEGELRLALPPQIDTPDVWSALLQQDQGDDLASAMEFDPGDDVVALFIGVLRSPQEVWAQLEFTQLLNAYLHRASEQDHFRGVQVIAQIIGREVELPATARRLLPALKLDSMMQLQRMLGIAGEGRLGVWIARWLAPYTGRDGVLARARLLEQVGAYQDAMAECASLASATAPILLSIDEGRAASLSFEDLQFINHYCRTQAWIRISAQRNDADWDAASARPFMERIDAIAHAWPGQRDPEATRERENYWALLHEWNGELSEAITHHRRAIELPAVPLYRVLGSTINLGRTMRDLAVSVALKEPHLLGPQQWQQIQRELQEAESTIVTGYEGKLEIGDNNEAPIGAHNIALCRLYLAAVAQRLGEDPHAAASAALAVARDGIALLELTHSTRKLAMLTEEARIAARLLGEKWEVDMRTTTPTDHEPISGEDQRQLKNLSRLLQLEADPAPH